MTPPDFDKAELRALISEVLDGRVDDAGRASLNDLLKASPEARRFYRDHLELHARLHLDYTGGQALGSMPGSMAPRRTSRFPARTLALVAAAACLALLAVILWPRQPAVDEFATLEKASAARWESSELPTSEGSRLGRGTLRLAEGLVTLRFDSGAEVNIEAPAEVTIVDAMHCKLIRGIAVANVPESATGFRITTASVDVMDQGARFSVIVDDETGETRTQVFEGRVEVEHPRSGKAVALKAGQLNSADQIEIGEALTKEKETDWPDTIGPVRRGPDWLLLETHQDAYVGRAFFNHKEVHRSETLLLVKNGTVHRKSYLGFDLAGIDPDGIAEAELMLHFAPTGWGLASLVPDATFSVYGLLSGKPWNEQELRDENAPGNLGTNRPRLRGREVTKLGTFLIEQGVQRGQFGIQGESLADFLRARAGSEVTLIVLRDTPELESNGLVHGFASRRHPTLPAPTLAIRMRESGK